jgi:hypothetical protein
MLRKAIYLATFFVHLIGLLTIFIFVFLFNFGTTPNIDSLNNIRMNDFLLFLIPTFPFFVSFILNTIQLIISFQAQTRIKRVLETGINVLICGTFIYPLLIVLNLFMYLIIQPFLNNYSYGSGPDFAFYVFLLIVFVLGFVIVAPYYLLITRDFNALLNSETKKDSI